MSLIPYLTILIFLLPLYQNVDPSNVQIAFNDIYALADNDLYLRCPTTVDVYVWRKTNNGAKKLTDENGVVDLFDEHKYDVERTLFTITAITTDDEGSYSCGTESRVISTFRLRVIKIWKIQLQLFNSVSKVLYENSLESPQFVNETIDILLQTGTLFQWNYTSETYPRLELEVVNEHHLNMSNCEESSCLSMSEVEAFHRDDSTGLKKEISYQYFVNIQQLRMFTIHFNHYLWDELKSTFTYNFRLLVTEPLPPPLLRWLRFSKQELIFVHLSIAMNFFFQYLISCLAYSLFVIFRTKPIGRPFNSLSLHHRLLFFFNNFFHLILIPIWLSTISLPSSSAKHFPYLCAVLTCQFIGEIFTFITISLRYQTDDLLTNRSFFLLFLTHITSIVVVGISAGMIFFSPTTTIITTILNTILHIYISFRMMNEIACQPHLSIRTKKKQARKIARSNPKRISHTPDNPAVHQQTFNVKPTEQPETFQERIKSAKVKARPLKERQQLPIKLAPINLHKVNDDDYEID
ncbi:hypothetical protein SNEBB_000225 [Seison nebaliae]|nr:hypothetical protein SNEBB_000225 [Seison nebaliae]